MEDQGEDAAREAVRDSEVFVCMLTPSYLESSYCSKELNWARVFEKPIVSVYHVAVQCRTDIKGRAGRAGVDRVVRFEEDRHLEPGLLRGVAQNGARRGRRGAGEGGRQAASAGQVGGRRAQWRAAASREGHALWLRRGRLARATGQTLAGTKAKKVFITNLRTGRQQNACIWWGRYVGAALKPEQRCCTEGDVLGRWDPLPVKGSDWEAGDLFILADKAGQLLPRPKLRRALRRRPTRASSSVAPKKAKAKAKPKPKAKDAAPARMQRQRRTLAKRSRHRLEMGRYFR